MRTVDVDAMKMHCEIRLTDEDAEVLRNALQKMLNEAPTVEAFPEWRDQNIEVPVDERCVLGTVTGKVKGVICQDAYMLVCYDHESREWYSFEEPEETVYVRWWMPLPEPPEAIGNGTEV